MNIRNPRLRSLALCALTGALMLTGCQANPVSGGDGQIRHIVIVWLKPGADQAAVLAATNELSRIPGVIDCSAGTKLASDRPMVDSTYDIAIAITFDSEASLRAYDQSPIHKRVLEQVVKPNVDHFIVYDSKIERYDDGASTSAATRERRAAALENQRRIMKH